MIYGYITRQPHAGADYEGEIRHYARQNNLVLDSMIFDSHSNKIDWERREIHQLLKASPKNSELVVYEAANLGRSTSQVLCVLEFAMKRNVIVHFVKYNQIFTAEKTINIKQFLELMQHIESDFVAKRTTEALSRRRDAGLPLGRPKGKLNKSLKLDKHKKDILKYLSLKISKASIAKLIDCHPQTLYNYMEKRDLESKAERKKATS
jgi:DNA invertase Pin-like site-specific DNA recombinase